MTNHRRHERTECQTEAVIHYRGNSIRGKVENLSLRGLFVKTPQKVDVDEQVEISIYFHGADTELSFKLNATAVRATETGIGFNFRKIDIDSLALLKKAEEGIALSAPACN